MHFKAILCFIQNLLQQSQFKKIYLAISGDWQDIVNIVLRIIFGY